MEFHALHSEQGFVAATKQVNLARCVSQVARCNEQFNALFYASKHVTRKYESTSTPEDQLNSLQLTLLGQNYTHIVESLISFSGKFPPISLRPFFTVPARHHEYIELSVPYQRFLSPL